MNRQEKHLVIESLRADFAKSQATFLVGIEGLQVGDTQALRIALRKEGGKFCVIKNTLARIAIDDAVNSQPLKPYFKQEVALVFASKDASSVAKIICNYQKEQEKLTIIAGCMDARILDQKTVKFLGSLPPRDVVIAQMCGTLKAPISQFVFVLDQIRQKMGGASEQAVEQQSNN